MPSRFPSRDAAVTMISEGFNSPSVLEPGSGIVPALMNHGRLGEYLFLFGH